MYQIHSVSALVCCYCTFFENASLFHRMANLIPLDKWGQIVLQILIMTRFNFEPVQRPDHKQLNAPNRLVFDINLQQTGETPEVYTPDERLELMCA